MRRKEKLMRLVSNKGFQDIIMNSHSVQYLTNL